MISGDNLETASKCAVKAGIISEADRTNDEVCMTGARLMEIIGEPQKDVVNEKVVYSYPAESKDVIMSTIYRQAKVIARCTPEHKLALIVALQSVGQSVAVTADGLNDVPALQKADVGFCMG